MRIENCEMKRVVLAVVGLAITTGAALGQSVSKSASYELLSAPAGEIGGGGRVTGSGGTIVAETSTGDAASGVVSNVTGMGVQAKGNLVGQLYDVAGLAVWAMPGTVDEGAMRQMEAEATMDDATTLGVAAWMVNWSESSAALSGVDGNGLVSAGIVYENTVATVGGSYLAISDPDGFDLTVVNVGVDDFGTYAGDGLDDDWQVFYFDLPPNVAAAPGQNPDGDGDTNLREFLFGFDPTDGADFFQVNPEGFSGASVFDLRLNKVIPGRTYTVEASPDLAVPFSTVGAPFTVGGETPNYLFQDTGAGAGRKFYRVEVSQP